MIPSLCIFAHAALVEYVMHRWVMHPPAILGKGIVWYREHAVEHHGRGRNDINMDMPLATVVLGYSPLFVGCFWWGFMFGLLVLAAAVTYKCVWTALHRADHDVGCLWVKRLPGWQTHHAHHVAHHRWPLSNFGFVFTFTDRFFFTRRRDP